MNIRFVTGIWKCRTASGFPAHNYASRIRRSVHK